MSFTVHHEGALEYLRADALEGVVHCFSTRYGGVSEGYLSSLNLGVHRGDTPENLQKNYEILGAAVGFRPEDLVFTHQIHSAIVRRVGKGNRGEGLLRPVPCDCDGLITNEPGVALAAFSADCTPILLFDPVRGAVGAVHAGWRGTAAGIVKKAVEAMTREFGTDPADLRAAIGPCIGPCCFETGPEVPEAMRNALGAEAETAVRPVGEKYYVNLKELNRLWLRRSGVERIDVSPDCTHCQPNRFWSHRHTGFDRGAQAAIIQLRPERSDAPWPNA